MVVVVHEAGEGGMDSVDLLDEARQGIDEALPELQEVEVGVVGIYGIFCPHDSRSSLLYPLTKGKGPESA